MLRTIGLMSGTSLDGVDAAWLETDGERIGAFGPTADDAVRRPAAGATCGASWTSRRGWTPTTGGCKSAAARLTEYHVRAVAALGRQADLIGFHGQTILHQPDRRRTWQIGDAAELAWRTGVPVAHDFRSADVAAGGQGAPLAPVYHAALARGMATPLAVLNIGGVANVTWIGPDGAPDRVRHRAGQWPAGRLDRATHGRAVRPGWRDRAVRAGRSAGAGQAAGASLFRQAGAEVAGPAGLRGRAGRERSGGAVSGRRRGDAGGLHRRRGRRGAASRLRRCAGWSRGGGRRNPAIMQALRDRLGVPVDPVEALGWDGDALEAQCFGFLAARTQAGLPISFPDTTGISVALTGGTITRPAAGSGP